MTIARSTHSTEPTRPRSRLPGLIVCAALSIEVGQLAAQPASAAASIANAASDPAPRENRGNDPFLKISNAIAGCPVPMGPLETEQEWLDEAHYRIERGNSCWIEGRCRLSNSYLYDKEIAESVQRRLASIRLSTQWFEQTSLWLTLQRRFIMVQGCVAPQFDLNRFLNELGKTADVDRVIDQTIQGTRANPSPYPLAPIRPASRALGLPGAR